MSSGKDPVPAPSDHFDGRRFFNPGFSARNNLWDLLRWQSTRRRARWPRWVEDPALPAGPPPQPGPGEVAATFVNHSTFLIQYAGLNVLTDPVWSERVSPLGWAGPRRVRRPGLALDDLPAVHVVLVSHNHYDHMDLATLRRLRRRFDPLVVTALGNRAYLRRRGLGQVEELDWWQSLAAGGLHLTLTPARHFSARGLFDRDRTLWGGFLLQGGPATVYFAADSGYGPHFAEVARRAGPIDLALVPIGAYEPRWFMARSHVNPAEAVRAHLDLRAAQSVAMHFGTFQLTDEPIDEPVRALGEALAQEQVRADRFRVLAHGETITVWGAG
jgi:L-ascorbate metabolism protein UlaG (beta-lactamase superfamily)